MYDDKKYHKEYYQANKERIKANNKAYREAHKEYYSAKNKEWREKNKEYFKKYAMKGIIHD